MDRRFNDRFAADLPVLITQLDDGLESTGRLEDISDSGICSLGAISWTPGAIIKLEILGMTLYGHVVYSNPEDDGFRTGVYVEPALLDSSNITEALKNHLTVTAGRGVERTSFEPA
jgi:hypothetical protein